MQNNRVFELLDSIPENVQEQAAPGTVESVLSQLPQNGKVLVAGAGRGGLSWLLDKAGYQVTSIDLHPEHFAIDGMQCTFGDLHAPLAYESNHFDIVLAVEVMEHLENPWFFFREAIRVINQDGVFIFTTPNVASLMSRWTFFLTGILPYFRKESFVGCYHVTPIHPWAVDRCCLTTPAKVVDISYSRFDFPRSNDIPRHDGGLGWRRKLMDLFPLNVHTGEIACFKLVKTNSEPVIDIGVHYK